VAAPRGIKVAAGTSRNYPSPSLRWGLDVQPGYARRGIGDSIGAILKVRRHRRLDELDRFALGDEQFGSAAASPVDVDDACSSAVGRNRALRAF